MSPEEIRTELENNRSLVYDRDGNFTDLYYYKGIPLPVVPTIPSVISTIQNFPLRDNDIFICAYPTAGTHWIWEATNMIVRGKAERIPRVKEEYMVDFIESEKFESLESPRVLNSHFYPSFLPEKLLKENKIIFVARNPKAVAVSYYRHTFGITETHYNGNFPSFFEMFMKGDVPTGDYFKYTKQWWSVIKDKPNALIVTYEDASEDFQKVVLTIAEFLDKKISDQLALEIADMCSFDKMKKEKKVVKEGLLQITFKENCSFYRSGKVSTWKEWLTVDQSERLDARIQSELIDQEIILNI
ncbi:sulfotransferase 1A1 isoform X2 [Octopus bimaculoides]|uniref:Sulfotransferase domain-containing protein n=1 Tax=Octopus bimaculoides TaxID=37653 RepID=A0A0L8I535_OCTBM|nr:sulfotransferase 1A1 isoform X2 [Octopus bimaculoides]XP_052822577.1 sulfotransferase 1A1 isoform X2 [Octopus bimaculoides]|eukprot:XP_014790789.1 PREDICTED: sulfotransferase 1A1-like isoform X1 [Octopus bimaculoides]